MKNFVELNNEEVLDVNGGASSYTTFSNDAIRIYKATNSTPNSVLGLGGRILNSKVIQKNGEYMNMNVYRRDDGRKVITYNTIKNSSSLNFTL